MLMVWFSEMYERVDGIQDIQRPAGEGCIDAE
jgi:hypothetical protein